MLDHKLNENTITAITGDKFKIHLSDESCDFVLCSHVSEHIPQCRLPLVVSEIKSLISHG